MDEFLLQYFNHALRAGGAKLLDTQFVTPHLESLGAIEVPREALPPTGEDEYYDFELIGLEVVEEGGASLGHVKAVEHGVANDAIALESGLLLPLVGACVIAIDVEAGRILVAPGFSTPD